jgi:ribosomal protein S8
MSQDVVSDALSKIMNAKKSKKQEVLISKYSKVLMSLLEIVKKNGYITSYEINKNDKKLKIVFGKINECNAIKPRFEVRAREIEKYIRRYLPARNFGMIIISTSKGLMTHYEALEKEMGGSLIAYFY